jgi:hypothetical protein
LGRSRINTWPRVTGCSRVLLLDINFHKMSDFLISKVIFRHGITVQHVQWAMDLPGAPHNKTLGLARLRMKVMAELTYQLQTFFIRISVEVRVRQLGHRQRCLLDELFKVAQELLVCQRRILDKVCAKQEPTSLVCTCENTIDITLD